MILRVEITAKNDSVRFSFAADIGKFGTWEQYDEYELTVGELLDVLRNNDECGFEYKTDEG
jgi:hypothetical protein